MSMYIDVMICDIEGKLIEFQFSSTKTFLEEAKHYLDYNVISLDLVDKNRNICMNEEGLRDIGILKVCDLCSFLKQKEE